MDIFEAYEMSSDAVDNGVWAELIVGRKKIGRIRVRSMDPDINAEYRNSLNVAALAAVAMAKDGNSVEPPDASITNAIIADTVLTDWELWTTDDDGEEVPLPYTREKAIELLETLPKFKTALQQAANNWTNYRKSEVAEAVKS